MAPHKRKAAPTHAAAAPTIVNYFYAPANVTFAAPAVAAAAPEPVRWLPPPPSRDSRVIQKKRGGLRMQCNHCHNRKTHGPEQFVPVRNLRAAVKYIKTVAALAEARAAKDGAAYLAARETIETLATAWCAPCRASHAESAVKPTTKIGACRVGPHH